MPRIRAALTPLSRPIDFTKGTLAILGQDDEVGRMDETGWLDRVFRSGAELTVPRRFLTPYLTSLNGDQFKVLFAVYCQWQLCERPLSLRVRPSEIGRLCDLSVTEVHWILNQLVQIGYLDAQLAVDLDGFRVTIVPASQIRG